MFFKAALKTEWDSSRKLPKVIDLAEDNPRAVHIYLQWLYTKSLPGTIDMLDLAKTFVFGEKIMDNKYKNQVVQKIMNHNIVTERLAEAVNEIYRGTPPVSRARLLMASIVSRSAQGNDKWGLVFAALEEEPLVQIMKMLAEFRRHLPEKSWLQFKAFYLEQEDAVV